MNTIRFIFQAVETQWREGWEPNVKAFERENPDIRVKPILIRVPELPMKVLTSMAAGNPAEVIGLDAKMMAQLVASKAIDTVPQWLEEEIRKNFVAPAIDMTEFEGKLYGGNEHLNFILPIFYLPMWKEAGLDLPKTWGQLPRPNGRPCESKLG